MHIGEGGRWGDSYHSLCIVTKVIKKAEYVSVHQNEKCSKENDKTEI